MTSLIQLLKAPPFKLSNSPLLYLSSQAVSGCKASSRPCTAEPLPSCTAAAAGEAATFSFFERLGGLADGIRGVATLTDGSLFCSRGTRGLCLRFFFFFRPTESSSDSPGEELDPSSPEPSLEPLALSPSRPSRSSSSDSSMCSLASPSMGADSSMRFLLSAKDNTPLFMSSSSSSASSSLSASSASAS